MVARRIIATLALLLLPPLSLWAQNYSSADTVTEYPNKGTFYHDMFEGRKTASGEVFDQNKFTAAHWRIKLGTYVMVTNRNSGLQVIVRVNDRCPKRGVFDMSHRAANAIGIRGMQPVTIRLLPDGYEERWAAQDALFDSVHTRLTHSSDTPTAPTGTIKPPHEAGKCNLMLATAESHSTAYTLIGHLPSSLVEKAVVEPLEGSDSLRITLDTRCSRKEAERLVGTLKSTFPKVQILSVE